MTKSLSQNWLAVGSGWVGLNFDIAIEHILSLSRVFFVMDVDYSILFEKKSI